MARDFMGKGRKRPQLNIQITRLHLDLNNPRLPEDVQGSNEGNVLGALKKEFDLEELAYSLSENGYFDEEPIVVVPTEIPSQFRNKSDETLGQDKDYLSFISDPKREFFVIEGNRRVATIMLLLSDELRKKFNIKTWPAISSAIRKDIEEIPAIVYPKRDRVLQYLGVRHITGIKKWESFAKARYIAYLIEKGFTIDQIQARVGDRSNSVRKIYFCYSLVKKAQDEFDVDVKKVEEYFSYLLLATGQSSVKNYLSIPERWAEVNFRNPVPKKKMDNLKNIFSWLFGEGKDKRPVINESRDITNYLTHILWHKPAIAHLIATRNLAEAFERTDAEEKLVESYIMKANLYLEKALGFIHRNKTEKVKDELSKCRETLKVMLKAFED